MLWCRNTFHSDDVVPNCDNAQLINKSPAASEILKYEQRESRLESYLPGDVIMRRCGSRVALRNQRDRNLRKDGEHMDPIHAGLVGCGLVRTWVRGGLQTCQVSNTES